eukprot:3668644-Rhodomonas_salina.3
MRSGLGRWPVMCRKNGSTQLLHVMAQPHSRCRTGRVRARDLPCCCGAVAGCLPAATCPGKRLAKKYAASEELEDAGAEGAESAGRAGGAAASGGGDVLVVSDDVSVSAFPGPLNSAGPMPFVVLVGILARGFVVGLPSRNSETCVWALDATSGLT